MRGSDQDETGQHTDEAQADEDDERRKSDGPLPLEGEQSQER